jgi:hypothetical protein
MQTTISKKDPRLAEAEEDFEKLQKLLSKESGIRETSRIKQIKDALRIFLSYQFGGATRCYKIYRLKKGRYPDEDIMKIIRQKMVNILPLFKSSQKNALFS